jgi:hypothetical protein
MNSLFLTLFSIFAGGCFWRYFAFPLIDIPDISVTNIVLPIIPSAETYFNSSSAFVNIPYGSLLYGNILGSTYDSVYTLPPLFFYVICCVPYLLTSFGIFFASKSLASSFPIHKNLIYKLAVLTCAFPSTIYYLIAPKAEAYWLAFLIVCSFILVIQISFSNYFDLGSRKLFAWLLWSLPFLVILLSFFQDNQFIIALMFFALNLFAVLRFHKFFPDRIRFSLTLERKNFRLYFIVFSLLIAFASVSGSLIYALNERVSVLGLGHISTVADHSINYYAEVLFKYNLSFRFYNTFSTFVFATANGFTIALAFKVAIIGLFLISLKNCLPLLPNPKLYFSMFFVNVLVIFLVLSVFAGYSNYKYWMYMTPILLLPLAVCNFNRVILLLIFVYLEISFRSLFSFV